jgi:hypothetical protein
MPLRTAEHIAIAGGTVAAALLDALVRKNILTTAEARAVMDDAQVRLQPFMRQADTAESARIISEWRGGLPKNSP